MPKEIKTTIAVDGEAAFKRAINDATTSIRNMGTQLTLAQAKFKQDGDAMKLMETRSKALKGEIGQQEEIVKALEKAVSDSATAYGETSDKTEKWEAELNRAKAKLVSLQNELTLNEQGLDRNGKAFDDGATHAADYQATLQTIGKNVSFETVTSGINGVTGVIETAIKKVWNFAKSIRETFADAATWADDLITDATKYGMDVETLQQWQNAADLIDTPVETIISAQDKLAKKIKSGWKGGDDGKLDMWKVLGIDLKDADTGKAKDTMDIMWDLGETLMSISEMEKQGSTNLDADVLSMEVFGKSWRELIPLFSAGREEWEKTVAEQDVVSKERVKALGELDDANQALENSWDVTKYSFLAELAPTVTDVTNAVTDMLKAFNKWMDSDEGKTAMNDLSAAIQELFSGLKDVSFKDAIDKVSGAINGVKDALNWLSEHKDDIYTALEIIGAGFALLKVSELALNIGKIVSGFRTLWSGASNPLPQLPSTNTPTTGTSGTGTGGESSGSGGNSTAGNAASASGSAIGAKISSWIPAAKDLLSGLFTEASVFAAAITPAVIAQKETENQWIAEKEAAEAAAETAKETGKNVELLEEMNASLGPKSDGNGGYKRGMFGFLDMNPTSGAQDILDKLTSPDNREQLMADLFLYGKENDNINGWTPQGMIKRYTDDDQSDPLNQSDIEGLVEYLRDIEIEKLNNPTEEVAFGYTEQDKNAALQDWWASHLNVMNGLEEQSEEDAAFDRFMEVFGDEFSDVFFSITEKLNELDSSQTPESIPDSWWKFSGDDGTLSINNGVSGTTLDDAVSEMKINTDATKTASEKIASADFKKFNSLPGDIQKSVQNGASAGVSGIKVYLDGSTVGRLVAPYVSAIIASNAQ